MSLTLFTVEALEGLLAGVPALGFEVLMVVALITFRIGKDMMLGSTYAGARRFALATDILSVPLFLMLIALAIHKLIV